MGRPEFRWRLAGDDAGQGALFDADELLDRHVGTGEFRGIEFLHVNARRVINSVPAQSRMPFRHTINAYRGCSHACSYCVGPDSRVLMGDGTTRRISDLRVGEHVYGTEKRGAYRRYVRTEVLDHWSTIREGYRVRLEDGTEIIASGDHRFLTNRGWKHVTGTGSGIDCRPHLTTTNHLLGTGAFAVGPKDTPDYRIGYLTGMVRGDGCIGRWTYARRTGGGSTVVLFRLALKDFEPLERVASYLEDLLGIQLRRRVFQAARERHAEMRSVFSARRDEVDQIEQLITWPSRPSDDWTKGFLAGIFDAEGSNSGCIRISNRDPEILGRTGEAMDRLGVRYVVEPILDHRAGSIRVVGGAVEVLRFLHTVGPVIARKQDLVGRAIKNQARLRVTAVEALGFSVPMYDITTGTGDFIVEGVVSHNCFARPTHEYLGLNTGEDFERRIVVKVNAVERVRAELASPKWGGEHIAMGTNTDPYQRCEGKYHLTRGIVQALGDARNPFSILTKSTLVVRDLDLLVWASARTDVTVSFSIGTLEEEVWRTSEPGTPHPRQRINALRRLTAAGLRCGVLVAPLLPGLSDRPDQVKAVVKACREAGASSVTPIMLHLRPGVREHFMGWLKDAYPDLVDTYEDLYRGRSYLRKQDQSAISASR